jgi:hypothetical protein
MMYFVTMFRMHAHRILSQFSNLKRRELERSCLITNIKRDFKNANQRLIIRSNKV